MCQRRHHLRSRSVVLSGLHGHTNDSISRANLAAVDELALFDDGNTEARQVVATSGVEPRHFRGVHSNGFSLVRKVLEQAGADGSTRYGPDQRPLIDDLLKPTQLYPALVQALLEAKVPLHGMAHITGGGLPENLPRCLPEGCQARVNPDSWPRPALFDWLQSAGDIPERDLWHTFNNGIGFCLVVPADAADAVVATCQGAGHQAWRIGAIEPGKNDSGLLGIPA